jgi:transposase-like protein
MAAERGIIVSYETIGRWVAHLGLIHASSAARLTSSINGNGRRSGQSCRAEGTCLNVQGRWRCLYRVIDRDGNLIDRTLSATRTWREM